ncbi:MAG: 30S ribosomal protein S12 methylthiotransferase RimO [Bacteroidales bacterium]|nr:30S ribosomal protein S12 methylthiotransferase RimO [Bacteroidales bacterium]
MKTKLKNKSINIITMGCSKNLVDSEHLMGQLKANDLRVVHENEDIKNDIVIINTCGFINDAKEESIDMILDAVEAKKAGEIEKVYVMGCLSERYKKELPDEIIGVDGFYGASDLQKIVKDLGADYKYELVGERILTTPSHYAYLKISEGCDRKCSFCAIPLIRGKHVSVPKEELLLEAKKLADKGVKELILIAQDLIWYGIDLYKKQALADLIQELAKIEGIAWIRLHYTFPTNFPQEVLDIIRQEPKVANYIDIPLQHISDRILRSMKRGHTGKGTRELVQTMRDKVPDVAIRTTFIVGYPGETEEEFQELLDFIKETRFERLGVFTYSPEEDTSAFKLEDDIPEEVKQERKERLMELQAEISNEINQQRIGSVNKVIVDRYEAPYFVGRTQYDSPEVDNEVLIEGEKGDLQIGQFYTIKITEADSFDLYGKRI